MSDKSSKTDLAIYMALQKEPQSLSEIKTNIDTLVTDRTLRRWLTELVFTGKVARTGAQRSTKYHAIIRKAALEFSFLAGKSDAKKQAIINQIRDLWTHTSTAIEGNTLSLGDTHFLLEEGLTVSGKPIKEHQEVIGHASAIELLYRTLDDDIDEAFCFALHKAIQSEVVWDIDKPNGAWKVIVNGTYTVDENDKAIYLEYSSPQHVAKLMKMFFSELREMGNEITAENSHTAYAKLHAQFAHIHPFWDGNGRIARLLANIPLLRSGLPPIVIPSERRREYIQLLARYQVSIGTLTPDTGICPDESKLTTFAVFCKECYQSTLDIII